MIILIVLYGFYLVLLLTNTPLMYVIDKTVLLFVWYYFFYKALFLKVVVLEHSFKSDGIFRIRRTTMTMMNTGFSVNAMQRK